MLATAVNRAIESARAYHDGTAHSPASVSASTHRLDWNNQPSPFKVYPELPPIPLPRDLPTLELDALAALAGPGAGRARLDRDGLAALLFFSAGITKTRTYPGGGRQFFRAAPSTGALYQTEVYVVAGDMAGLPAGVYHYSPGDFALRRLREGDFRGALAVAAADDGIALQQATVILTAIYWRNTWKYQARGYRHLFWDSGSLLANLLACAGALDTPARLVTGFIERDVNGLLGIDVEKEGALVLAPVGLEGPSAGISPLVGLLDHAVVPLSSSEVDYPVLRDAYYNSSFDSEAEVLDWREGEARAESADGGRAGAISRPPLTVEERVAQPPTSLTPELPRIPLPPPKLAAGRSLAATIMRRGSTRQFSGEPISAVEFSTALYHASRGWPADVPAGFVELFVNVHAVEGIEPGAYRYDRAGHALALIRRGDFRRESSFLSLGQMLGGASSATVFFLADLGEILPRWGNRGYRVANLEAGLIGGRLYLAAYAQGFGATGLTFYDRAVVEFFSPASAGLDALFVTALGRSASAPREVK